MPLVIKLKPFEGLIINGALIRNRDQRAEFVIETQCKFLRESETTPEHEAKTPCEMMHVALARIYLADDPYIAKSVFHAHAAEVLRSVPGSFQRVKIIHQALEAGEFHKAVKRGKDLVVFEQATMAQSADQAAVA